LIHGEEQGMKNVWPAFIWNVLRNAVIAGHCSFGVWWSYIPMKWQHWWIDDFAMLHVGDAISMEVPKPVFEEIMEM
jgi:hypothetical protein